MRVLIINPNTTASMTEKIAIAARAVARSGTVVTALNPARGPAAIQGPEDGAAALPGLFALFDEEIETKRAHDMAVIACFDDTGLMELKARSSIPVLGIGEAAFHAAMLIGDRFSVVTTLSVSVPVIEQNLARYGFSARCARVRASEIPVLELENSPDAVFETLAAEISRALGEDGCQSIVLGCAGMADLAATLTRQFDVPVIDGVAAAIALGESLHQLSRP